MGFLCGFFGGFFGWVFLDGFFIANPGTGMCPSIAPQEKQQQQSLLPEVQALRENFS